MVLLTSNRLIFRHEKAFRGNYIGDHQIFIVNQESILSKISELEKVRKQYQPKLPPCLSNGVKNVAITAGDPTQSMADQNEIKELFPNTYGMPVLKFSESENSSATKALKVGVILSGGQAPGGHNVIAGIFDGIKNANPDSQLFGFLGGPSGLEDNEYQILTDEIIDAHRNTGGFDIIGSGRTKLETEEQFEKCIKVIDEHGLDAIVIIGGDDSNTNAAVLGEYLKSRGKEVCTIGIPKTIDGDLKNEYIPTSFGFDTAVKTYSEVVGNICRDACSAKKYWHFIKLMGRSASHIALEVGLQTQPNVVLVSEEVEQKQQSLTDIVNQITSSVVARAKAGKNFGIVLVPEGLIEFIPSMKALIANLNDSLAEHEEEFNKLESVSAKIKIVSEWLSPESLEVFNTLPGKIQAQLLYDRDPHGNVQVSRIETEVLLVELVENRLKELKEAGEYNGKFSEQHHFFGYEGRCAPPSNFDADYTYSLGYAAVILINSGKTGYMASVTNVTKPADQWQAGGIPITMLLNLEQRHGKQKPVIRKALVELDGKPFKAMDDVREEWSVEDAYVFPGPIQYFGPAEVCDMVNKTLALENE